VCCIRWELLGHGWTFDGLNVTGFALTGVSSLQPGICLESSMMLARCLVWREDRSGSAVFDLHGSAWTPDLNGRSVWSLWTQCV
jgi:hypothetical protein